MQHLFEGLDPTGLACITTAQLLQMIRSAYPYPRQGFTIWQSTGPDTVTYPELKYFLWVKTADDISYIPTGEIYYYDGSAWVDFTQVDGSRLVAGSAPLTALSLTGGSVYDILQISAGGVLAWTDIISAIQGNTIPPVKLLAPDAINKYLLTCFAGTKVFKLVADFFSQIDANVIPIAKLVHGGADALGLYLRTNLAGTSTEFANVDVANLAAAGAAASQGIRRNSGNTAWEYFTPTALAATILDNGGSYYAIPASGAATPNIAHGQASIPKFVRVVARCSATDAGYSTGDEVDISGIHTDFDGTDQYPAFTVSTNATNIVISRCSETGASTGLHINAKTGGDSPFDPLQWAFKIYVLC